MKRSQALLNQTALYLFPGLALLLALFAKETSQAARNALYLCLDVVIPSLFPFFVLSRLMVPYMRHFSCPAFVKKFFYRIFGLPFYFLPAVIIGYLSGYPAGAKLAKDMFEEGLLDAQQASRIIAVANSCSPLFIVGTVGAALFKSVSIGFILLAIHWLSGLCAAFILSLVNRRREETKNSTLFYDGLPLKEKKETRRLSSMVPSAIEDAAILAIKVSGYIVLFAVLTELLGRLGVFSFLGGALTLFLPAQNGSTGFSEIVVSVLKGLMEITSGSKAISVTLNATITVQLAAVSLICGFAGFSVHTQVMGIMRGTGARYRVFLTGKIIHGLIACILTLLILSFLPMSIQTSSIDLAATTGNIAFRVLTLFLLIGSLLINPCERKDAGKYRKQISKT